MNSYKRRGRGPAQKTLALTAAIVDILEEIQPASVRAVCYRLFVAGHIANMSKGQTDKVSRVLVAAREAGRVPWAWVVDENRTTEAYRAHIRELAQAKRRLDKPPRMADFAVWAATGLPALGFTADEFMSAYTRNREHLAEMAVEASPVASALVQFMTSRDTITGRGRLSICWTAWRTPVPALPLGRRGRDRPRGCSGRFAALRQLCGPLASRWCNGRRNPGMSSTCASAVSTFQTFQLGHLWLELLELTGRPMLQMFQPKPAPLELLEGLELQNPPCTAGSRTLPASVRSASVSRGPPQTRLFG